jgi:AcrR family transcriptional regulator
MLNTKPDRRVARTRAALLQAFVALLLSEGYESVTVEDIAARANVGRSTFYVHFRGREDILKTSLATVSTSLAALVAEGRTAEQLVPLMDHFWEQRRRNHVVFEQPVRRIWIACLADLIEPGLVGPYRRTGCKIPTALAATQIAETQLGWIANWLRANARLTPIAAAQTLVQLTRATAAALVER